MAELVFDLCHLLPGYNHDTLVDCQQLALMRKLFLDICRPPAQKNYLEEEKSTELGRAVVNREWLAGIVHFSSKFNFKLQGQVGSQVQVEVPHVYYTSRYERLKGLFKCIHVPTYALESLLSRFGCCRTKLSETVPNIAVANIQLNTTLVIVNCTCANVSGFLQGYIRCWLQGS